MHVVIADADDPRTKDGGDGALRVDDSVEAAIHDRFDEIAAAEVRLLVGWHGYGRVFGVNGGQQTCLFI